MAESITNAPNRAAFRRDVRQLLESRLLKAVELVLEEELADMLGAGPHERTEQRQGYRNGALERGLTTSGGHRVIRVPRGRIVGEDGVAQEFRSAVLPRYSRRTREVDEAILGIYLAGANSRRIRKALEPLLGEANLSKSAVSRVVGRLKEQFAEWQRRDLSALRCVIVYLDGFHLKVRMARRVVAVPVLAVLGVAEDGRKVLLTLRLAASEAAVNWSEVIEDLQRRGLGEPLVVVVDGHAGLGKALAAWPGARVQRCVQHKWQNLAEHCPAHARREVKRDYDRIVMARDGMSAREARAAFLRKWTRLCPEVARSLEEAGDELLSYYDFPKAMWKSLRSTNPLENLNREFRRRTKTQGSFGTEEGALTLLFALVAFGQIRMRRIDGHRALSALLAEAASRAA